MTTPSSVPAQGEAMEVLQACRDALMECDRDCDYPLIDRIDALVAASPCAAQPPDDKQLLQAFKIPDAALSLVGMLRDDVIVGDFQRAVVAGCRAVLARFAPAAAAQGGQQPEPVAQPAFDEFLGGGTKVTPAELIAKVAAAPAPTAQGGQQPAGVTFPMPDKPGLTMACFDAQTVPVRTPLYTAPAPAAPLTARMLTPQEVAGIDAEFYGGDPTEYANAAIRKFCEVNGITLAGTTESKS